MNDLQSALWTVWLCYWLSAALIGSFIGTLLALSVRALFKKVLKWYRKGASK